MPGRIDIFSPNPNLAPEIRAFSGKWAGTWDTGRRAILVVGTMDPKEERAEVIYALGSDIGRRGNWRRYQAVIQEGTLSFASKATANAFEFRLKEPDELEGRLNYQASRLGTSAFRYVRMRRIE